MIASRLAMVAVAALSAFTGVPVGAEEGVAPAVRLFVTPEERAALGTELELVATMGLTPEGSVTFFDGAEPVATGEFVLDGDVVYASARYTPPTQGVHELRAEYDDGPSGTPPPTSPTVVYSVLPATCPDQATPGSGATVRLAYLTILHRCPDPGGFAYWTDRLDGGTSAATLGRSLALSAEGVTATVDLAYRRVLDRPADAGGRAVWSAKVRSGWTTSQLWAALAAAPEFVAGASGADPTSALVDRAFTRFLGRPADAVGRAYWSSRVLASRSRSAALRALTLTPEALTRTIRTDVLATLGRVATPSDQAASQAAIKARRGDWRLLVADLLGRPEASAHAQRYPDLEADG